jgi:hypothetical protein
MDWIGKRLPIRIVRPQCPHDFVGRDAVPNVCEYIFQSPEEVIRPVEALCRVASTSEKVSLPGTIRRDTRPAVFFTFIRHRIYRDGDAGGQHQVHFLFLDQFGRDFATA